MLARFVCSTAVGKALSSSRWPNADICVWANRCFARRRYSEEPPKAQRTSPLGIQVLSPSLHHQIFNCAPAPSESWAAEERAWSCDG